MNLPSWLTLNGATLSGTAPAILSQAPATTAPAASPLDGSLTVYNFSVSVTDVAGAVSSPQAVSLTVNPPVQITTPSGLPSTSSSVAYSQTFTTSGGTGNITWTVTNRPSWLAQNGATLSGIAPAVSVPANYVFTMTATDSVGSFTSQSFTITVNPGITIVTAPALGPWTATRPFATTLTAIGGSSPYLFTDPNNTLPTWLGLTITGALSGTPPAAATYSFTIKVTDSLGASISKAFSLIVNAVPAVNTSSLPATTSGVAYSQTLTSLNGTPPFTWSAVNLPSWLTLTGATLSGTAPAVTVPTPYNFSVAVTDFAGAVSTTQPLSITVNPPVQITTSSPLASTSSGLSYSQTFTSTGGTGTITWTVANRPTWLSQNGATLSGTAPVVTGSTNYVFTMTATDAVGASASQAFTVTVNAGITLATAPNLGPWTATRPYTTTLVAVGGKAPYQFADAGTTLPTLPTWLSVTAAGTLSGIPPAAGNYSFTIKVTDSLSASATKAFTLLVNPVPSVSTTTLPATTSGVAYAQTLINNGGTSPFAWAPANPSSWLTLSPGGVLTGTAPAATAATPYNFSVTVTDAPGAASAPQSLSVTVNPPVNILTTSPLPQATAGLPYSTLFSASGGTGTLTWSSPNLPGWLTLNGAVLSGTPPITASGSSVNFTVRASDAVGAYAVQGFVLPIAAGALTITTGSQLPSWTVGRPYSAALTAAGGKPPYGNWTVATASALPAGLQLDAPTGVIHGTPTAAGGATFTVQVSDSAPTTVSKTFTLTINPQPAITTSTLPAGSQGIPYLQTLSETGGTTPLSWSATGLAGTGLSLTQGGTLLGTPTVAGPATIQFTAILTDAAGATAQAALSVTIGSSISISTASALPPTTSGRPYSTTLAATGGAGTLTFSAGPGSNLPSWLSLAPGGNLTGTAPSVAAAVNFRFTITVTDTKQLSASKTFALTVNPLPVVTASSLPSGTVGAPYSQTLSAKGGTGTLTFGSQNLPTWLTLTAAGTLSGVPTAAGPVTFSVIATDSLGAQSVPTALTVQINAPGGLPFVTTPCPFSTTTEGLTVTKTVTAAGGFPPYTWSATSLPAWLTLGGSSGSLTGVASPGSFTFTLQATDSHGQPASQPCGILVNPAPVIVTTTLPPGTAGSQYWQPLSATGGTGTLTWSSQGLPPWLAIDPATGILSGTPPSNGTFTFAVQVTDSLGAASAAASLALTVSSPGGVPVITACPLPTGTVGAASIFPLTAALGFPPYSWSVSGLPAQLTATAGGTVSGTPAAAGVFTVGLTVTDAANQSASTSCVFQVSASPAVLTSALPDGTVSAPYWQPLSATGGTGNLIWSASSLPVWLTLDPALGVLSGTPTLAGNYAFTLQVTDSLGFQSPPMPLNLRVTAAGGTFAITTACPLPDTTESLLISDTFTAKQGTPPYTWSATALPAGMVLGSTGLLSGIAQAGDLSFSVQAIDQQQQTAAESCGLHINPKPAIATPSLQAGTIGFAYSQTLTTTGGTGHLLWSVRGLPRGLNINPTTGALSGTPLATGTFTLTVRVSDTLGVSDSKSLPLTISPVANPAVPTLTTSCPLPNAAAGVPYSQALQAAGGNPPYSWFVSNLPAGMTFDPAGSVGGTPLADGSAQLLIETIDSHLSANTAICGLNVTPAGPLTVLSVVAPAGSVGATYSGALTAAGGVSPYVWSVQSGTLPPGVVLNPSGTLTGKPTSAGNFQFTALVTDAAGSTASAKVTINVTQSLTIGPATLPDAVGGTPYSQTLTAAGATGTVAWSLTAGALPDGLNLASATGKISGTPTKAGKFPFTVTAVDSSQATASAALTITVGLAPIPQVTITGLPATINPAQQLTVGLSLAAAYPLDTQGQLTLTVTPDPSVAIVDPAVQFASGGATVSFRVPANSTQATFTQTPAFQTGTLAGAIQLSVTLQSGGIAVSPPAPATVSGQIPNLAPVIVGTPVVTRISGGIQVVLTGFATNRLVTSAVFHFSGSPGSNLQGTDITVPLQDILSTWYASPQSAAYGSLFSLTQTFTVQGDTSQVTGVSVTLTNKVGNSQTASVNF